jgi:hypothetical protein
MVALGVDARVDHRDSRAGDVEALRDRAGREAAHADDPVGPGQNATESEAAEPSAPLADLLAVNHHE